MLQLAWIDVNGVSLNYRLHGRANNPLIVLIHEIGGSLEGFSGVVPYLEGNFSVLTYDQRGAGQSEKVIGTFTIDDLTDDVMALVSELIGERSLNFVTVAAAGQIALRVLERFPDRVNSIAMCNPALGVDESRSSALDDRADFVEKNGIRAGLDVTLEKSYPVELRDEKNFPNFRGRYLSNDPHGFAEANRILAHTDLRHLIPKITCPVLVAAGRFDQVRPAEGSKQVASQIHNARFEMLDGGHFLPTTAPDALGEVLMNFYNSIEM